MARLVLASASPRRRELLAWAGLSFEVVPADLDEQVRPGEAARAYVERLAREKAAAVAAAHPLAHVLAADTSVVVDGDILGKPGLDAELGRQMLRRLSGRTHEVLTGVAVAHAGQVRSQVVTTAVRFLALQPAAIEWYVGTQEGADKAGGYASQARAGAFIEALSGSSTNVIGLPLPEALRLLAEAGFPLAWDGL